ncbi:MAG TPA: hypothetical protein VLA21_02755, partial [Candidatus Limnocylindria bacterium]|nr:hypothetical protein [Candidatus Limnocylindria bacterium]
PDGSPAPDGLVIALVPETEAVAQVLADIVQQAQGLPVTSTYFATYQEAIQGVLPEGADLAALELQELTGLVVSGYEEAMGDVAVRFGFPTLFDPLKPVVVLVGLAEGDGVTWQVLEFAVSNADGGVDTIFPAELLLAVQAGQALIAVLQ